MKIKLAETIRLCMNSLRSYFDYEDCNKILIYIVFLKYIVDNKKIPLNNETFEIFLNAQRMLDKGVLEKELVTDLNYVLENHFDMTQGSLTAFSNLYFRVIELSTSQKIDIVEQLKCATFEKESDSVLDALKIVLWNNASSFGRMMGDQISSKSLTDLIKALLTLENGEQFADFTYGLGLSSLGIVANVKSELTGYEINEQASTMAQMLLIISENKNFHFYNQDVTMSNIALDAFDKIVSLPPLGLKVRELSCNQEALLQAYDLPVKPANLEVLIALQGIKSLKENGKMIMAITPNMLFSATTVEKKFRELIANHYLSAVIALPSLYYGTNVATTLIVLEKNRNKDNVIFIDASRNDYFSFVNKDKNILSYESIAKLVELVRNKQTVEGLSYTCGIDEIQKNDCSLSPTRYVEVKRERVTLSNEEIDKRLCQLYAEIKQMIK